ncbi:MAG: hypothetical protein IM581_14360 [Chitinophagaceae bacterium]|nr:hypothetical protein [Chitinophagaceae bacterium]
MDYWKYLRDNLEDFHKSDKDKKELDKIVDLLTYKAKEKNYNELVTAYKGFLGRKSIKWFDPPYKQWKNNELLIKINPELGLNINGRKYVIKLYFKSDNITKNRVDLILTLLKKELTSRTSDFEVALLDIRAKKLYAADKIDAEILMPLLIGEANSFETIWKRV